MSEALVHFATDQEINDGITSLLADAGVTYEELLEQAQKGRFVSGKARQAWFIIASLGAE